MTTSENQNSSLSPVNHGRNSNELSVAAIIGAIDLVLASVAGFLGNIEQLAGSYSIIGGMIILTIGVSYLLWRKRNIGLATATLLTYSAVTTGLLIFVLNQFASTLPVHVIGSVLVHDGQNQVPAIACIEILDLSRTSVGKSISDQEHDGNFTIYNIPSGNYTLYVNNKPKMSFQVQSGYAKLLQTTLSGHLKLFPVLVEVPQQNTNSPTTQNGFSGPIVLPPVNPTCDSPIT